MHEGCASSFRQRERETHKRFRIARCALITAANPVPDSAARLIRSGRGGEKNMDEISQLLCVCHWNRGAGCVSRTYVLSFEYAHPDNVYIRRSSMRRAGVAYRNGALMAFFRGPERAPQIPLNFVVFSILISHAQGVSASQLL